MKLSWFGRLALALFASLALGLGMSACGGGTVAYLWVLGTSLSQTGNTSGEVAAFKVDDFTGNLTQTPHQPFASQGANPITILVKAGGRFVYVLNQGSNDTPTSNGGGSGVAVFSVGGDGTLNYLQTYQSQGFQPMWMQFDATNGFLYVLDKYSPAYQSNPNPPAGSKPYDVNGSITAFSIDPVTGRLTLVLNTQSVPPNSPAPTYWEVGQSPFQMKQAGSCLFTVNSADQSITPYSLGGGGQLVNVTTGIFHPGANNISSINGNGSLVILTDNGNNTILPFSISSNCTLSSSLGGPAQNQPGTSNPTYSFISSNNKFLYVLNQSTTSTTVTQPFSSVTGYNLQNPSLANSYLTGSPFPVDSGPVCMVQDPTNKYLYVSAHNSGQVTGKLFDANTGELSQLSRGSTFSATGLAQCLAISGAVD
jgi:6-phosphogluconolactonase (cycloisomerase 2 family)